MIRTALPADVPRLREICVRTGAAGADATGRWSRDDLLPQLFLDPYLAAAPDWAWVVDDPELDADAPVGYLVCAPDTVAFVDWWRREWTPLFARSWSRPPGRAGATARVEDAGALDAEAELVARGFSPEVLLVAEVATHPAHLHIDLLPVAQGRGWGRRLIGTLGRALAAAGVRGVHLTIDPANAGAAAFYPRLGFTPLETPHTFGIGARAAARLS